MYCKKCGVRLEEGANFCSKCGQKVDLKLQEAVFEEEWLKEEENTKQPELLLKLTRLVEKINFGDLWRKGVASGKLPIFMGVLVVFLLVCLGFLLRGMFGGNRLQLDQQTVAEHPVSEANRREIDEILAASSGMLAQGDYEGALANYNQAKAIDAQYEQSYLFGADLYLKQNNYNMALQILDEGYQVTGMTSLLQRREYICNNVVLVGVKSEDGEKNFFRQYNEAGNLFREHKYSEVYELTGWEEIEYDASGNKIKSVTYDAQGVQTSNNGFAYDERGILLSKTDFDAEGKVLAIHQYSYDAAGRQSESKDYDSKGELTWSTKTEYDEQGRKVKDMGYDKLGSLKSWVETTYNQDGMVQKMARYDESGNVVEWNEYQYDSEGKQIRFTTYGQDNEVLYWTESEYSETGVETRRTRYNADGSIHSWCEFDLAGKKVKERIESQQTTYLHAYYYFGDILFEGNIKPVYGQIRILQPINYRNVPNPASSYTGTLYTDKTYTIVGQTDTFYQLDEGGYLEKALAGVAYATVE